MQAAIIEGINLDNEMTDEELDKLDEMYAKLFISFSRAKKWLEKHNEAAK